MYLGNFIKNIGKKYSKLEFSGIAFDSRKVKKNYKYSYNKQAFRNTKSYGGFFHLEPSGMKKRHVFVMDGYGGQTLMIDFDTGRIVTTLAVHRDFNWMKIAHSVIKKGK